MTDFEGQREKQEAVLTLPEHGVHSLNVCTEDEQLPYPAVAPVVCLCLKQTTVPRKWCLKVTCGPWLDYVSILMVLINCVTLGMYKPCEKKSAILEVLDYFIFAFFMLEMLIKMMALGILGYKGSYLSDNWNKFDIFIISGELLDYSLAAFGIQVQVCHVFRPMRLIRRVPSMRDLVIVLLKSMPMLVNALLLYMFVIHIFGVLAIQLWKGELRNRCFLGEDIQKKYNVSLSPYYMSKYGEKNPFICSSDDKHGMQHCRNVPPYSMQGKTCLLPAPHLDSSAPIVAGSSNNNCVNWNLYYNICRAGQHNLHMDTIHFDSIGYAWITIFQVVTLEGWTDIMNYIMDADSFWNLIFFILITVMGSFIMMNVCAVVIATQFSENMGRKTGEQRDGLVSFTQLCCKLTSWIKKKYRRYNRHHNRVHPRHSRSRSNASLRLAWMPLKKKLKRTVKSKVFDRGIMFAVFLSILTMAMEHYEQTVQLTIMLQISNIIFTVIFAMEMVIKLLALEWKYFSDQNNIFDFFIVIISLWEIIANTDSRLSVLRTFRLLRFVRLVHFLPYLRRQLLVLKRTIEEAAPLFGLLLFVTFIFSVMGMYLFGCKFKFKTQTGDIVSDRKNFDTLLWAMVTVFQILTQEDWNLVLYNAMATTSPWAALYFVAIIMFGKHTLLNVLVGIVVDSFQAKRYVSSDEDDSFSESDGPSPPRLTTENDSSQIENHSLTSNQEDSFSESTSPSPPSLATENDCLQTENSPSRPKQGCSLSPSGSIKSTVINSATEEGCVHTDTNEEKRSMYGIRKVLHWCKEHEDWSFYMLSPQNRFRVFCRRVISHKMFDHVILMFILLSCITLAVERPEIDPESTEQLVLNVAGYVFCGVFLVEMLLKILALGLLIGKHSYCRSSWNVMDGLLVILSFDHILVSLVTSSHDNMLGILKVLRLLRTLRPLRVVKQAPKLKLAVEALITSLKPIGNIVIICCAFFFFYGILGVQLFKGKFYYCVGEDTRNITNKTECLSADYSWIRKEYNFDSLPQALMALFVMYSKDGWVNIMYDGLDAVGVDQQPERNHNEWMLVFFISFMIMSFFLLDMFVGVMVDTFHHCQLQQKRRGLPEGAKAVLQEPEQIPYYEYYSPIRRVFHTLCTSNTMDLIVTVGIFSSVIMMAFEHYKQPEYIEKITEYSYYVFTTLLIIEVLLKLMAFGVRRFINVRWNLLDITVALVSIIGIVLNNVKTSHKLPFNPIILRACRVLRLAHVLKVKKIRVLLKTIIKTLSQVGNICLLFMFFFFIYAVLGVELFGKLECTDSNPCLGLNQHANFKNFGMALITLYQVCTGDNWSVILKDALRECHPDDHHDCLSYMNWVSPLFFISFVVMAQFVLVNLVVAAIMQAMEESIEGENMLGNDKTLPSPRVSAASTSSPVAAEGSTEECNTQT